MVVVETGLLVERDLTIFDVLHAMIVRTIVLAVRGVEVCIEEGAEPKDLVDVRTPGVEVLEVNEVVDVLSGVDVADAGREEIAEPGIPARMFVNALPGYDKWFGVVSSKPSTLAAAFTNESVPFLSPESS